MNISRFPSLTRNLRQPALVLAASLLSLAAAPAQTLINYNFNSLSTGALVGQDGWAVATQGYVSPSIANGPVGSVDTTLVAGNSASTGTSMAKKSFFSSGTLSSASTVTLEFDAARTTTGGTNLSTYGIGSSSTISAYFGLISNNFVLRGENFGTAYTATNVTANVGDWFTIRSVWDLSTGMATMYVKNLTAGATSYTQIIFTGGVTSVSLGLTSNVSTWTSGYIRTAQSGSSTGFLDNLSAVAVPEPGTTLLIGGGLLALFVFRRRSAR